MKLILLFMIIIILFILGVKSTDKNIKRVSRIEAHRIIETGLPLGKFYNKEGVFHVGIDNSIGDCWCEDFKTKKDCFKWLLEYEK